MVLPNGSRTRLDLTVLLGCPCEPTIVAPYKVTVCTLSVTMTGVSDEDIKRQSQSTNPASVSLASLKQPGDEANSVLSALVVVL